MLPGLGPARAFGIEQAAFTLETPAIATQPAISAQDSMAGHQHRDAIRGAGRRRRAHGTGLIDPFCEFRVTDDVTILEA